MHALPDGLALRRADSIDEIPPRTLYGIAALRQEVFVVEQECPYPDLDGRDLEPGAIQLWLEAPDGGIAATVRILDDERTPAHAGIDPEPGLRSIGRVVTSPAWRGKGLAAVLLEEGVRICDGSPIALYAQSHLAHWYARFGFEVAGAEFLEDGIPHLPMMRRPRA